MSSSANLMKAVICTKYGPPDVLELREVEIPVPKDNEVLVQVHATTVARGDAELRAMKLPLLFQLVGRLGFGIRGPRRGILGQELAGEIVSVGKGVKRFKAGDEVFAFTGFHLGAYAEYDCLSEGALVAKKPGNMTYEEAAAVPVGGLHALSFLKKADIRSGQKVLICGAGGSIGTFAVQIAKSFGATVTGVDSERKLETIRSIGASKVIDYTKEDFAKKGETYDVIFDVIGNASFSDCLNCLSENGVYLLGNPNSLSQRLRKRRDGKKIISEMSYRTGDLNSLRELIEAGKLRSVIDRRYALEEIVEAHRYVDTGQKIGNVVISVRET
jgi:NADPH:quinone reductase-like Zn-dependent oxidoreductase